MTKNNERKRLLLLILADILVVGLAVIAVISVLPLFSMKHIRNTADALFFDSSRISEITGGNAFEFSAELDIPDKLTEFEGDLHLSVGSAHDKSNDNGKADLEFSTGDNSLSLNLLYDSETVALKGFSTDNDSPVSLPRRNLKEAFDNSHFFYVSGSLHSMSMTGYNSLIPALDSSLDPDREDGIDSLSDVIDDAIRIADPTSSFILSKGRLCRRYTCSLDAEKVVKILGLFSALDEAQSQAMKDSIGNKTFNLTYVTDGKYITSAQISSAAVEAEVEFVYNGDMNSFKADIIYTFDTSGESIGVIGRTEYEITYFKTPTGSNLTADLTVWSQSEGSRDYSFKLNKTDSTYSLTLNENEIATGVCELDSEKLNFTVIDTETNTKLVSIALKKADSFVTDIPEHRPLLSMSEDELTDFFRGVPIKTASDLLKVIAEIDLSAFLTADGKLLMHTDKILTEAEKLYGPYVSLLKSTERKLLDSVSKIYIWNDRLKSYILFTYLRDTDSLELGCAYELTDEILAEYHIATLTENRIMTVHNLERTVNTQPDCENDGLEVWECKYCDYGYETVLPSPGHQYDYLNRAAYRHDGSFAVADLRQCRVCSYIPAVNVDLYHYCSYSLKRNDDGSYNIISYSQNSVYTWGNFYVPLPEDIELDIREIRVSLEKPVRTAAFPEGIIRISHNSFPLSKSFEILILPSTLTEIEDGAFYGVGKPRKIFYSGTKEAWEKIKLGEYSSLWSDVEIVFCPDGVKYEDYKNEIN